MRVREATSEDREAWNAFVDTEGGRFIQYYDWKPVYENKGAKYIPLLTENDSSEIVGILPIIREKRALSSIIHADTRTGGLLTKTSLSDTERYQVISELVKYVDTQYSRGCSRFTLKDNLALAEEMSEEASAAFIDNGFRFRYDKQTRLPCIFILELEQPFEENIWKGLWSSKFRQEMNKVKRSGVVIIQDSEFHYADVFIDMLSANYKRHGTIPPTRDEVMTTLSIFRDKAKLFVALLYDQPTVVLLCYYYDSICYLAEIGSYEKDTSDANKLCYVAAIEDACNEGYRYADLSVAATSSLALFKERFKATRVPFIIYEKNYSVIRTLIEQLPVLTKRAWHDKTYIWKKRRKLWDRLVHW
ncbi:MAG: GNAT family N-acetyltransferase [Dehalococcoidales bacterium]|nr:MAG: GNAT family N-acetyltransferase [Dehalococcoidales bacterium]